ncbi:MAG: FAD-dependent oxidoreductase [Patescibacteria group bacterium]|jgi:thioredoxin reductase (NADPH)|nr:FAD-dependent oxidoreductase [Patescibacteria group bacterium]
MKKLAILGAGPAGLTASIYASRYNIDHISIGAEMGGYLNEIHKIENYPGISSIAGFDLAQKMKEHAEGLGSEIIHGSVIGIKKIGNGFEIETEKEKYQAENIIFSIGTVFRKINIPGEKELTGKGVSYCATCDGPFFKNKKAVVVGGGNSAAVAALILSEFADHVDLIYRGDTLRCTPTFKDQMENSKNVDIIYETNIDEIKGETKVEKIILDKERNGSSEMAVDGVFIEVGSDPNVSLVNPIGVELDEKSYIKTNQNQSTNVEGFFAAGDITTNSNGFRQIITAASEGAIATLAVYEKIKSENN